MGLPDDEILGEYGLNKARMMKTVLSEMVAENEEKEAIQKWIHKKKRGGLRRRYRQRKRKSRQKWKTKKAIRTSSFIDCAKKMTSGKIRYEAEAPWLY